MHGIRYSHTLIPHVCVCTDCSVAPIEISSILFLFFHSHAIIFFGKKKTFHFPHVIYLYVNNLYNYLNVFVVLFCLFHRFKNIWFHLIDVHVQIRWYVDFWLIQLFIMDVDVWVYAYETLEHTSIAFQFDSKY